MGEGASKNVEAGNQQQENAQRSTSNVEDSTSKTAKTEGQRSEGREQPPSREATADQGSDQSEMTAQKKPQARHPSSLAAHPSGKQSREQGSLAEVAVPPASLRTEPLVEQGFRVTVDDVSRKADVKP